MYTVKGLSPRVRGNPEARGGLRMLQGSIPACAGEPRRRDSGAACSRVYPRVCGGTLARVQHGRDVAGLSPRVRGNHTEPGVRYQLRGSIPACAGEPRAWTRLGGWCRVYPRVCGGTLLGLTLAGTVDGSIPACAGEPIGRQGPLATCRVYPRVCGGTLETPPAPAGGAGLSPRVRGNPLVLAAAADCTGSIPACAGEPFRSRSRQGSRAVYPRVCGGTAPSFLQSASSAGLSPRVRGNLFAAPSGRPSRGSIPACAGEPLKRRGARSAPRVYPRVCGGTRHASLASSQLAGLSPRVRGNRHVTPPLPAARGSIPACAGEPAWRRSKRRCEWVYPRVCGGTTDSPATLWRRTGLSPRVRGNPSFLWRLRPVRGSIPACAGEPPTTRRLGCTFRVYPRVCGGTAFAVEGGLVSVGLSPRVRGNRGRRRRAHRGGGSIPACAGEPSETRLRRGREGVYPRVCGGTPRVSVRGFRRGGLSPRVRGNQALGGTLGGV